MGSRPSSSSADNLGIAEPGMGVEELEMFILTINKATARSLALPEATSVAMSFYQAIYTIVDGEDGALKSGLETNL